MFLASHFHDTIVRQALTSPLVILAGVVLLAVGFQRWGIAGRRWIGAAVVAVGLSATLAGGFRLVEVSALRHNHLCHNHHADDSSCDYRGGRAHSATHEHWFGGRAADR